MTESGTARGLIVRLVQFFLAFDGVLHVLEVFSAWYEKAYTTFVLTAFHALIFFLAIYFIGHDHTHHKHGHEESEQEENVGWPI